MSYRWQRDNSAEHRCSCCVGGHRHRRCRPPSHSLPTRCAPCHDSCCSSGAATADACDVEVLISSALLQLWGAVGGGAIPFEFEPSSGGSGWDGVLVVDKRCVYRREGGIEIPCQVMCTDVH